MNDHALVYPMFAMVVLTFAVLVALFFSARAWAPSARAR